MNEHTITKDISLCTALEELYPESSKRTRLNWVKAGRVLVDHQPVLKANQQLHSGQKLSLKAKESRQEFFGVKILYQDRWLVAIDKPAGLLSVRTENPEKEDALALLRSFLRTDSLFPVHRIDRETSGVLIFARGKESQERFDRLFLEHDLQREYIAVVEGRMKISSGTWTSSLLELGNYDVIATNDNTGKLAVTHYEVYRHSRIFSFLRLTLETGRKHQIRVQCKEAGYPIVGDVRYGSQMDPLKRLGLHAYALKFIHPFTQRRMEFLSPLPSIFKMVGAHLAFPCISDERLRS
jgi:23S rRNA pseudouridine1911/1915/1917 synthase